MAPEPQSTPLARIAERDRPTWVEFCGWRMPVQFEGIVAEHLAVRRRAGLFDISHMGRLFLRGPGADEAVERLLTRKTADMAPRDIRYSFIADLAGDILDDLMVARLADGWQLVVNAANRDRVVGQIRDAGCEALLDDRTSATAMLALQGPESAKILENVWPDSEPADRSRYKLWSAGRSGATLTGSRSGYTGEDGFEVFGSPEAVEALWAELRNAGVPPCGLGARDSLRNEAALPLYGHELREDTSPWELGLAYAVSLEKEFLGHEEFRRRRGAGIQRKRAGLVLVGRRIARENMAVRRDGRQVGMVTSGTWSPGAERPIAQAYLDREIAEKADQGTTVEIDVRGRPEQATVVSLGKLMPPR